VNYGCVEMSIVTKTGDAGKTALMYGRRVAKCDPRVEAYGTVDELNSALGLARAAARDRFLRDNLLLVQRDLVILMGELATTRDDLPRYVKDGYSLVRPRRTSRLEKLVHQIEVASADPKGWATPGEGVTSATLDLARAICRRAERRVCALQAAGQLRNAEIVVYLNRLSDLLWWLARWSGSRGSRKRRKQVQT
jgi:cob(I)alamin adenosyltransferase